MKFTGMLRIDAASLFLAIFSFIKRVIYRIEDLFKPSVKLPPDSERAEVELSPKGSTISVEMALNSRCSSDYDGNPKKFHWGMFDATKKLSNKQIEKVVNLSKIPLFTNQRAEIQSNKDILTFVINNQADAVQKEWMMVESGMQQQAVGLVCSALGIGSVINNLGKDGTRISRDDFATVKMKLDAMKPTYNGSFWTDRAPSGWSPWLRGNLPDPLRYGEKPLIATLAGLKTNHEGTNKYTEETVSQLLWAARGRTPHLYKTRPWGLTIPTWGGEQDISSVYLISNYRLYKYINWYRNRSTHSLEELNKINEDLMYKLEKLFPSNKNLIVLGKNENFNRSLWEVGYQLLNMLLQAHALDMPYEAALLDEDQKSALRNIGIKDPVAIVALLCSYHVEKKENMIHEKTKDRNF